MTVARPADLVLDGVDEPLRAEVFSPPGAGPWPAMVVLSEAWGLNDDLRRIAARFAENGYLAVVPDLYRGGAWYRCVWSAFLALQRGRGAEVDDLRALIAAVSERDDVRSVGVVGFCMGGGYALLLGTTTDAGAAGVFYGEISPAVDWSRACPVVGGYGRRDLPFRKVYRDLVGRLEEAGVDHDVVMYPGAGHSFMNDAGHRVLAALSWPVMAVGYEEAAAEDSWRRMLEFFARHL